MTPDLSAAIDRLISRRAAGIDVRGRAKRSRKGRVDLRLNGSLGVSPEEGRGRRRARLGRVARFDEK